MILLAANDFAGIPRLYTAIAEWVAILIFILPREKRLSLFKLIAYLAGALIVQIFYQRLISTWSENFWILGMSGAILLMYFHIYFIAQVNKRTALFHTAFAFILAELAASFEWQIHIYFWAGELNELNLFQFLFFIFVIGTAFLAAFFIEKRQSSFEPRVVIRNREIITITLVAIIAFLVSNLSFVAADTPFSSRYSREIYYIRTLVDFCALAILYMLREQYHSMRLHSEVQAIQAIMTRQFETFKETQETIRLINLRYHDLKNHLLIVKAEKDESTKEKIINEIESGINQFELKHFTGNTILDTIINSKSMLIQSNRIQLTCVADGQALNFLRAIDISTIFGNSLDNAIENCIKIKDLEKRLIKIAIFEQSNFLVIRVENYYENELLYENDYLLTTKSDNKLHGYGLKSIKYAAEKNDGHMTIDTSNNWFVLKILIPSRKK